MTNKFILDLGNQLHKFVLDAMKFTHKLKFDLRAYVNDDFRLNTFLSQEGKLVFFPKRKKKKEITAQEILEEVCRQ